MPRKSIKAWAAVGTHGLPFCCLLSPNPALENRYEIYDSLKAAQRSGPFVREVTITLGPHVRPLGKDGDARANKAEVRK